MNLVKAAELLKNAPEDTLKKYLANPNGEFPEYLVSSELLRREDMRERYAAELSGQPPKTSIIEELLQRDNASQRAPQQMPAQMPQEVPSEAMGLGAVPPPDGMQLSPAPMLAVAQQPQQFAGGGAVAFADGGLTGLANQIEDYMGYASGGAVNYADGGGIYSFSPELLSQLNKGTADPQNLQYWQGQAKEMLGESGLEGWQGELQKQREEIEGRRKNYLPDFLIRAGLGMASSKSNPLQAAAEGAAQGFEFYQKSKAADELAKRNLSESQFKFKQAERAERAGLLNISQNMYNNAMTQYQQGLKNRVDAEQANIVGQHYKDSAKYYADKIGIDKQQLSITAADMVLRRGQQDLQRQDQKQYREELIEDRRTQRRLEAAKIRDSLVKRRTELEGVLQMPGGEYQERVKMLKKQFKDPYALDRAISDLRKSYEKQAGITDLEDVLAEYNK